MFEELVGVVYYSEELGTAANRTGSCPPTRIFR
jgi:hypothetical protein